MKNNVIRFIKLVILLGLLTLTTVASFAKGQHASEDNKVIFVSIPPLKFVVSDIVGEAFTVKSIVKEGTNAENYSPTLSQIQELTRASAYISIGLPFETDLIETIQKKNKNIFVREVGSSIERVEEIGHHHEEDEEEEDEHMEDEEIEGNPHIWMGISNMMTIAKDILELVQQLDASQSEKFAQNYDILILLLENTKREVGSTLSPYAHRSFLIYHPVLDYFAREFNLEQIVVQQEGREGSLKELKEVQERAKETNAKLIFIQKGFPNSSANTLAAQLNLQVEEIKPLDEDWINEILVLTTKLEFSYEN